MINRKAAPKSAATREKMRLAQQARRNTEKTNGAAPAISQEEIDAALWRDGIASHVARAQRMAESAENRAYLDRVIAAYKAAHTLNRGGMLMLAHASQAWRDMIEGRYLTADDTAFMNAGRFGADDLEAPERDLYAIVAPAYDDMTSNVLPF